MKTKKMLLIPLGLLLIGFVLGAVFMSSDSYQDTTEKENFVVDNAPFFDIFFNNLLMCMLFIAGCGVLSSVMALVQGISFGAIFGIWLTVGNSAYDFVLLFLPHVIFEVVAMVVASMIGFSILSYLLSTEKTSFSNLAKSQLPKFCTVCLCVLAGAVVESFLTPAIYNFICN